MRSDFFWRALTRLIIFLLIIGILWLFLAHQLKRLKNETAAFDPSPETNLSTPPPPSATPAPEEVPVGEKILADYLAPNQTAKNDLQILHRLLDTFFIAIKNTDNLPMSANEEIVSTLAGQRKNKLPFLRLPHPAINDQGQLIDRWGSPVHFHQTGQKQYEIRTAGPDRVLYTDDDFFINHQGRFQVPNKSEF